MVAATTGRVRSTLKRGGKGGHCGDGGDGGCGDGGSGDGGDCGNGSMMQAGGRGAGGRGQGGVIALMVYHSKVGFEG
jgi:hypothetical protein